MKKSGTKKETSNPPGSGKIQKGFKRNIKATAYGFNCSDGTITRFCARYRLAKGFRSIELAGFNKSTIEGYTGLFKVFLAYSAFESLCLCLTGKDIFLKYNPKLLNGIDVEKIIGELNKLDTDGKFYDFIYHQTKDNFLRKEIEKFKSGTDVNILYLAAGIRHIFVHGSLSAHSNGVTPVRVRNICSVLYTVLFEVMDQEFTKRIDCLA